MPALTSSSKDLSVLSSLVFAVLVVLIGCVVIPPGMVAQTTSAGVSGRITDQSGAVIVDAEVEIKSTQRNDSITVKTNGDGLYNIPVLTPGHYLINVRKPGFKSVTVTELELNIQDNVVRNFALQVGSVAETITINGNDIQLNTTDASVSTVVDQTYVKNMPLNGRSFQDLILLTPGVVTQTPQLRTSSLGTTGEFSVSGQRTESNYYTVDGVSANVEAAVAGGSFVALGGPSGSLPASTALGTTQALVSVDALQEFRVQSSTYSAEYGRNPGGQFAFETKSGTNQWHGSAYDYLRNGFFDAHDWFSNYFGKAQPALRQNDFGGTVGGPVRVPKLYNGKDKAFFFFSYEGLRLTAPQAVETSNVPDLCMRGAGPCPTSGPGAGRKPAASALLPVVNSYPLPSANGLEDAANGVGQFIGSWSDPSSLDSTSFRLDHLVNDKLKLFFRFSDTRSDSKVRAGTTTTAPNSTRTDADTLRTYTAGISNRLGFKLNNEFRLNYSSNEASELNVIEPIGGSSSLSLFQLTGLRPDNSFPTLLFFLGPHPLLFLGQGPSTAAQRQWNLVDTIGIQLGRHQMRLGVDFRRLAPSVIQPYFAQYFFFGEGRVESNSPFFRGLRVAPAYPLYKNVSLFAQDEWKLLPRLSLSFGLRWEVNPAPGVTKGLKPYTLQGSDPNSWMLAPQGTPLWHTTWYNFAPRLGAAYLLRNAPGSETVVRGGVGVFFDTGQQQGSLGFFGPGFELLKGNFSTPYPFPGNPAQLAPIIVNPPVPPYGQVVYGYAAHLQLPYTLQWNTSVEQALGRSQALTVSYVGSHASRLLRENSFNPPNNPNATSFTWVQNGLTSDYDSLQVQFRRRLSTGLTALGSYTWSHCIDYGSLDYEFGYQRGNCDFDVRHNFSAAFSYDLPNVGHNGFANALLQHWGLDDRFTARTAFPVTLQGQTVVDPFGQQFYAGLDRVPGQPIYLYGANCDSTLQGLHDLNPGQGCPGGRAINPLAFSDVTSGLGNAPRNFARGFGAWQMNVAVRRDFPIYERLKLQFRAEAFDIFNHPNFGTINSGYCPSNCSFGQATSTLANSLGPIGLNSLYQMGGARSMQFALKLVF